MTELTTTLLLTHRGAFHNVIIPFPELGHVNSLANKCELMHTAETLGVHIPRTWHMDNNKTEIDIRNTPTFPAVIKPGKSWPNIHGQWQRAAVRFPENAIELNKLTETDTAFQVHPYLLQEHVNGEGQGVFAAYDQGRPLAFFGRRCGRGLPLPPLSTRLWAATRTGEDLQDRKTTTLVAGRPREAIPRR